LIGTGRLSGNETSILRYGLFMWGRRRFGEELADLETGLQADRICAGEQKVQREDLKSER
jgi:hypothetical protein